MGVLAGMVSLCPDGAIWLASYAQLNATNLRSKIERNSLDGSRQETRSGGTVDGTRNQ